MIAPLTLLASALPILLAQECTYTAGGDMPGFEFPPDILRQFPGVLDRECDLPPPAGQPRDPEFCLPQRPFAPQKDEVCNRCPPQPKNYFRLPLWEKYQEFREVVDEPQFRRTRPHLFERNARGGLTRQLKHGVCLTCYALAKPPPPQVLGPTDIRKPSVTVTTRVACGRQNEAKDSFLMPDTTLLKMWNGQIEDLADQDDPCTHFPCGDNEEVARRASVLAKIQEIATGRDQHIASFIKNYTDPRTGEVKAVNGHHNDLMEIPFGKAHVLRTEINLNPGLQGYSADIKDGGYSYFDESGREVEYDGCQAMEYGMVALSPGLVDTACWMVPLFADPSGRPDPYLREWRSEEYRKDQEIKAKVQTDAAKMANLLRQYCVDMRPGMSKELTHGAYERATRTCELLFCIRPYQPNSPEDAACKQVAADAERYKELAAQRAQRAAAGAGQAGAPPQGGPRLQG